MAGNAKGKPGPLRLPGGRTLRPSMPNGSSELSARRRLIIDAFGVRVSPPDVGFTLLVLVLAIPRLVCISQIKCFLARELRQFGL